MKFKSDQDEQNNVRISKNLYNNLIELIQLEIDKLTLLKSGEFYFDNNGFKKYSKFFKYLYKDCDKIKSCLTLYLRDTCKVVPEFTIPEASSDFKDSVEPFKMLAKMEDLFENKLTELANIAFEDKDWKSFYYFLSKFDKCTHLCCKALAAVENNQDVMELCEQPFWDI